MNRHEAIIKTYSNVVHHGTRRGMLRDEIHEAQPANACRGLPRCPPRTCELQQVRGHSLAIARLACRASEHPKRVFGSQFISTARPC